MNTKSTLFTVLIVQNEYCCTKITKWLLLALIFLPMQTAFAAPCSWGADVMFIEGDEKDEIQFELFGSVSQGIAYCKGYMFGYNEAGTLFLKQYDRKTTWVGDDNVTFVLALYGELLSADTIETATKVPLTIWGATDHYDGIAIDDPSDFYFGFMTPESKTADGIPRYGWYHLSITDDLNDITLLDSGIGLYGESVYVGIGVTPEPSSAMLLLLGCAGLLLRRQRCKSEVRS